MVKPGRPSAPPGTPAFLKMKTILTADWAPHLERAVRRIVCAALFVYVFGLMTRDLLRRLINRLAGSQARVIASRTQPALPPVPAPPLLPPPAPTTPADPMACAVLLVRSGARSQRQAAILCGVSRTSLQRALKR
jgi:hypothetical protein